MPLLNALAERKGLFAITALASAILLIGALLPGYYVWTVNYEINPLTHDEKIHLPKTTGATIDWVWIAYPDVREYPDYTIFVSEMVAMAEEYGIPLVESEVIDLPKPKKIWVDKPVDVYFRISPADQEKLLGASACFWDLLINIGIFEQGDPDGDGTPNEYVGMACLIINDQEWVRKEASINLAHPGAYDVAISIISWTGAVATPVSNSFDIQIYAVEKPLMGGEKG